MPEAHDSYSKAAQIEVIYQNTLKDSRLRIFATQQLAFGIKDGRVEDHESLLPLFKIENFILDFVKANSYA